MPRFIPAGFSVCGAWGSGARLLNKKKKLEGEEGELEYEAGELEYGEG